MNEKQLYKKWFSNPVFYDSTNIRDMKCTPTHSVDIALIYSGRNRGKSFDICARAIIEAFYSKGARTFGYIRRYDKELTAYAVEQYFADKLELIQDLTDGICNCVICDKKMIYLGKDYIDEKGHSKREKVLHIGYVFSLNLANQYKSLQYPTVHTLLFEEVFTIDGYIPNEVDKLLGLISTVQRNKEDFICYMISNLVSKINPYTQGLSLKGVLKQKAGTIDEYRLYKGTRDENGQEEFYYICVEYLEDLDNEIDVKEKKKNRNRLLSSVTSNKWEENYLLPCASSKTMREFETLYTSVFEYNEFRYLCEVKNVPINLQFVLNHYIDTDEMLEYHTSTMQVLFISRKTSKVSDNTRLHTTNALITPMATRGYYILNDKDKEVDKLLKIGWCFFSDNLTGNEFKESFKELKKYSF